MKFLFILNSGYPTQKAYGVTTKHTIDALIDMGEEPELWAPQSDFPFSERFEIKDTSRLKPIRDSSLSDSSLRGLVYLNFLLREISFSYRVIREKKFELNDNLVWVRDVPLAFWSEFLARPKYVVLEVHHLPKGLQSPMLRLLAHRKDVILAGISEKISLAITKKYKPRYPVITCPMAAPESFYLLPIQGKKQVETLGYMGKYTSSGNENGITRVLNQFAEAKKRIPELKLKLIGIEDEWIESLKRDSNQLGVQDSVEIFGHLNGEALMKEVKKIDIGLIPYPESKYNSNRFPIKSVEYAALGITILATRTSAHIKLLRKDFTYFYDPEVTSSLSAALVGISDDSEAADAKRLKAREWAETHRYPVRVGNVLLEIERRGRTQFYN